MSRLARYVVFVAVVFPIGFALDRTGVLAHERRIEGAVMMVALLVGLAVLGAFRRGRPDPIREALWRNGRVVPYAVSGLLAAAAIVFAVGVSNKPGSEGALAVVCAALAALVLVPDWHGAR